MKDKLKNAFIIGLIFLKILSHGVIIIQRQLILKLYTVKRLSSVMTLKILLSGINGVFTSLLLCLSLSSLQELGLHEHSLWQRAESQERLKHKSIALDVNFVSMNSNFCYKLKLHLLYKGDQNCNKNLPRVLLLLMK